MNIYDIAKSCLVVLLVGSIVFVLEFKSKSLKSKLLRDGSLTIGYITKYVRGGPPGVSPGYFYKYSNKEDGKEFHKKESYKLPSYKERKKINTCDSFLVIYYRKESRLLFDYPINNRSDFERYVKEFEKKRKIQK